MYGTYYGRHEIHLEWLNREFEEMGMTVENLHGEFGGKENDPSSENRELQKRTQEGILQRLFDVNVKMFNEMERDIERSNISMLNPKKADISRPRKAARKREFTITDQVFWSDARSVAIDS
jgi:hypothetical protein